MAKASTKWEEGQSGNPAGRPSGQISKPISPLRKTLNKLKELEDQALENISAVVNGKKVVLDGKEQEVDKQKLETSKWVVGSIASLTRAALQDEELRLKIKMGNLGDNQEEPQAKKEDGEEEEKEGKVSFSLSLVKDNKE